MIRIYGIAQSRAFRPLWLLEELGVEYAHVRLDYRGDDLNSPGFRALNPNGRVPTLVDGELVLWESMAIDLYLARNYGATTGLWPDDIAGEALTWQWSFWVVTEVERPLLTVLMHNRVLPEEKRDPARVSRNLGVLQAPFGVLDRALQGRDYLLGERFTVADLNVAAVFAWCTPARVPLEDYPNLSRWLTRCLARPACKRAQHS